MLNGKATYFRANPVSHGRGFGSARVYWMLPPNGNTWGRLSIGDALLPEGSSDSNSYKGRESTSCSTRFASVSRDLRSLRRALSLYVPRASLLLYPLPGSSRYFAQIPHVVRFLWRQVCQSETSLIDRGSRQFKNYRLGSSRRITFILREEFLG